MIRTESDRLTALIHNILELSRLERNVRRYRLDEGSLCAVVADVVEFFRHSADANGFAIETELPPTPLRTEREAQPFGANSPHPKFSDAVT